MLPGKRIPSKAHPEVTDDQESHHVGGGERNYERRKRKMGIQRSSTSVSGNFPSKFVRGQGSQPIRSAGVKREERRSVGQRVRQTVASYPTHSRLLFPECKTCGKKHIGICTKKGKTCYKCGKIGHYVNSCPQSNLICYKCGKTGHKRKDCKASRTAMSGQSGTAPDKTPTARTFNMTPKDAVRDADVITGTPNLILRLHMF